MIKATDNNGRYREYNFVRAMSREAIIGLFLRVCWADNLQRASLFYGTEEIASYNNTKCRIPDKVRKLARRNFSDLPVKQVA